MNFAPFGSSFPGTITGLPQFTSSGNIQTTIVAPTQSSTLVSDTSVVTNIVNLNYNPPTNTNMTSHFNQQTLTSTTTSIPTKFRTDELLTEKYNGGQHLSSTTNSTNQQQQQQQPQQQYTVSYNQPSEDKQRLVAASITYPTQNTITIASTGSNNQQAQTQEISQDLCNAILQQTQQQQQQQQINQQQQQQQQQQSSQQQNVDSKRGLQNSSSWQTSIASNATVADYLSHLPANSIPLSLHQFLKYSAENIKKETTQNNQSTASTSINSINIPQHQSNQIQLQQQNQQLLNQQPPSNSQNNQSQCNNLNDNVLTTIATVTVTAPPKKKKRKRPPKERKPKPRPGEIRLTTALDGSPLFMCPECQVAYPEPGLLEIHLVGHNLERRYVCDICNAALKRKDHLTRHKQSHNPDRPYICTVCLKAFKRKEQLSLHFVIHSGEKRHICMECGKGFYRKDHLRKHTRSHIARRVKAELTQNQQNGPMNGATGTVQNQVQHTNGQIIQQQTIQQ